SPGFETSPTTAAHSAPEDSRRSRRRFSPSLSMSPAAILAPSEANRSAVARPIPIAAPVMTADFPSSPLTKARNRPKSSWPRSGRISVRDFGEKISDFALLVRPEPLTGEELTGDHQHLAGLGGDHRAIALGPAHDARDADRNPRMLLDVPIA